jgi:hypothetical protein
MHVLCLFAVDRDESRRRSLHWPCGVYLARRAQRAVHATVHASMRALFLDKS